MRGVFNLPYGLTLEVFEASNGCYFVIENKEGVKLEVWLNNEDLTSLKKFLSIINSP